MRILIISSYLPFPLFSGGHIRLYNLIKQLSKKHSIKLVCEKRDYQTQKDIDEVKQYCQGVITVPRKKQWSMQNIIKASFSSVPFLLVGHTNSFMKQQIQLLLEKQTFDVIHVETFYVMQNVPTTLVPIVLAEHNIEYLVYKRFVKRLPLVIRPLFSIDVWKIKRYEELFWQKATKLVAVSETEKKLMKRDDIVVVPNGADIEKFKVQSSPLRQGFAGQAKFKVDRKEKRVLFIGDFKWIQNRDAVEWILKEIWPSIKNHEIRIMNQEISLWIVGRNIPESIKQLGDGSVLFDDSNKQETEQIFREADVLLAPIRVGGGTSYKILEAMASGVAVVTTPLGAGGLEVKQNKELLVSDSPEGLAQSTLQLLADKSLYELITKNARKLVEEKYNWETIAKKLEDVYESALK